MVDVARSSEESLSMEEAPRPGKMVVENAEADCAEKSCERKSTAQNSMIAGYVEESAKLDGAHSACLTGHKPFGVFFSS